MGAFISCLIASMSTHEIGTASIGEAIGVWPRKEIMESAPTQDMLQVHSVANPRKTRHLPFEEGMGSLQDASQSRFGSHMHMRAEAQVVIKESS